jgi:hypothetical protein
MCHWHEAGAKFPTLDENSARSPEESSQNRNATFEPSRIVT